MSSVQGTPYDYLSVMHYGKNEFSNGNGSTVITKRPEFQDVIGQRMEMSEYDAFELNGLYKCSKYFYFNVLYLCNIYKELTRAFATEHFSQKFLKEPFLF